MATQILLILAAIHSPPGEMPAELAPTEDLVRHAAEVFRSRPKEERELLAGFLVDAYVDLGRDAEAIEISRSVRGFSDADFYKSHVDRIARRLGRVPDEDILKIAINDHFGNRVAVYSRIARSLALAHAPEAAETALQRIPQEGLGLQIRAVAACYVADSYRRARDITGERRMISVFLETAEESAPDIFTMEQFSPGIVFRAVEIGEEDALRSLLDAGEKRVFEDDGIVNTLPDHTVRYWSRLGRWRALLGDTKGAGRAFEQAEMCAANEAGKLSADNEPDLMKQRQNALDTALIAVEEKHAGMNARSEAAFKKAIERIQLMGDTFDRNVTYQLAATAVASTHVFGFSGYGKASTPDFELADRLIAEIDDPHQQIMTEAAVAWSAIEHQRPAEDRLAAIQNKVIKLPEYEPPDIHLYLALGELFAFAGRLDVAREHFQRVQNLALDEDFARREYIAVLHKLARENDSNLKDEDIAQLQKDFEFTPNWSQLSLVAHYQIESKMYADAWKTIRRIPENDSHYASAVGELTAALAERDAADPFE